MLKVFHCAFWRSFWVLAIAVSGLCACQPRPNAATATTIVQAPVRILSGEYAAHSNDVLKVTVYDEPDLSGEYIVGPDGKIALPLVGAVHVAGQTLAMMPATIAAAYRDGYLVDPKVSVELKGVH